MNTDKPKGDYCTRGLRAIPCVFIAAVVLWSYYAYVIELCVFTIESTTQKVCYILIFQVFFAMFTWSYWQTTFTDPANPTSEYSFPDGMYDRIRSASSETARQEVIKDLATTLPGLELKTPNGGYRYCNVTHRIKPDRCHYCSVVKQCVLKMDHYCPWVNNCVGYSNYKFFVLFLFYGLLYCLFVSLTSLPYFLRFWSNSWSGSSVAKFNILFLFFASSMFAFSITTLLSYHMWLVMKNRTTIESWRAPIFRSGNAEENGFNLGVKRNMEQVFGEKYLLWGIPIFTSLGDGQTFPSRLVQGDLESGTRSGSSSQANIIDHQQPPHQQTSFDNFTCENERIGDGFDTSMKSPLKPTTETYN